ncbi:MAG: hypothetical protein LBI31_05670, partial [Zoogloeaceae bacterium]|nr:hypothetical protein [Zoogloeaceae bacterium]
VGFSDKALIPPARAAFSALYTVPEARQRSDLFDRQALAVQPHSLLAPFAPRFSRQLASVFFVHQHYMGTMHQKSILNRRVNNECVCS